MNKTIFNNLKKLLNNSYSPYSKFQVAAIVIDKNGNQYAGVNVENAAFSPTSCAERTAIATAVTQGMKMGDVREVHILANSRNKNSKDNKKQFVSPCGPCRQVILEASASKAEIFMYNHDGEVEIDSITTLLPKGFTGKEF